MAALIRRLLEIDLPAPREIIVVNDGSSGGTRGVLDATTTAAGGVVACAPNKSALSAADPGASVRLRRHTRSFACEATAGTPSHRAI